MAFFLALIIASCLTGGGAASTAALPPRRAGERANLQYSDMQPGSLDLSAMERKLADLAALAQSGGDLANMVALFLGIDEVYNEIYTTRYLIQLKYFLGRADEDYAAFVDAQTAEANALEMVYQAGHLILGTEHRGAFAQWVGDDSIVATMERHVAPSDNVLRLRARETELVMAASAASRGDYSGVSVSLDDEEWTVDALLAAMDGDPERRKHTEEQYASIRNALMDAISRKAYDTMMELVDVRNEIASEYGYDDSFDMVWSRQWQRDYSYEDFLTMAGHLKRHLAAYHTDVTAIAAALAAKPYGGAVEDLLPGFLAMSPSEIIAEPMRTMIDHGLVLYGGEQSYAAGAFSEILPSYNQVGIYARFTGTLDVFTSLYHELGHAANQYWSKYSGLDINDVQLEIAETQSQSLQLMYADWFGTLPGDAAPVEEIVALELCSRMGAYVLDTAYTTELEYMIYTNPDMDYKTACQRAQRLYSAYTETELPAPNAWITGLAGLTADHQGYLLSYTVSNLCALEMYREYLTDAAAALDKFDRLVKVDNGTTFSEFVEAFGFECIYEESYYEQLAELMDAVLEKVT